MRSLLIECDDQLSLDTFLNFLCLKNFLEPALNKYKQIGNNSSDFEVVLGWFYN